MESLIKADIFFFISTIAIILVSIAALIALGYAIRILKIAKDISEKVRDEGMEVLADVRTLRKSLRDEGLKWKHVADLVRNFFIRKGSRVKKMADRLIK